MAKLVKKLFIVFGLVMVCFIVVNAATTGSTTTDDYQFYNYKFIEDAKLDSSRFTRVDDLSPVDVSYYVPISNDDQLVTENSNFKLYYDEDRVVFKVLNKQTDYVWSTAVENPSAGTFTSLLDTSIGIEYINTEKDMAVASNIGLLDTAYDITKENIQNGLNLDVKVNAYCPARCQRLYQGYLDGRYDLETMQKNGYVDLGIDFAFSVVLDDNGIVFNMPYTSISEAYPDTIKLSSIIVFPGLGATKMDEIPGYMVIPDGSGTLIRYEDNENKFIAPYEEKFYGSNMGLDSLKQSVTNYPLSMPIFGAVHGVYQNAFVGIIEKGAENASLIANPNGANNIAYNLIYPEFKLRETYRQSFSSDGSGGAMQYADMYKDDIQVRYNFLEAEKASYVGIGESYRDYLTQKGELQQLATSGDIDIWLNYLMSDSESSFFGSNLVRMSTVSEVDEMYKYFIAAGLENQRVSLMGWNEGGYSGRLPSAIDYENSLGSNASFHKLIDDINQQNSVMLMNDYIFATSDTKGISYLQDVAKGTNRFKMSFTIDDAVHKNRYILYPDVANKLATRAYDDYVKNNVQVLFEAIGSNLYSYYDGKYHTRQDSLSYFEDIMQTYQGIGNYATPNAYAFKYTQDYFSVPLYNSQLKYFDDLVPLLEIVLKGSMNLYSPFLNYNSLGKEQILTLIDFGVNPSFVLSYQPSSELKNTDLSRYFTTEYALWKDTVVEEYDYINGALKYVNGAYIESRDVLATGVVKISYSNNVDIYVNYTSNDYDLGADIVPAMNYLVGGDI